MTECLKDGIKHCMGTSCAKDRLKGAKWFRFLRDKIECGALIEVSDLIKLNDTYIYEPSVGFTITECFVFEILQDYRLNREFFLQYSTPSSLQRNTMELKEFIIEISPITFDFFEI